MKTLFELILNKFLFGGPNCVHGVAAAEFQNVAQPPPNPPVPPPAPNAGPPAPAPQFQSIADELANNPRVHQIMQQVRQANPPPPPPPPPAIGGAAANPGGYASIADELANSPQVRAMRVTANVRAREEAAGGHVLARHHPSLSDEALCRRLTTGLDPEGEPAPNPGVSSRFESEEVFYSTLRTVHQMLKTGLSNTRKYLRDPLANLAAAEAHFITVRHMRDLPMAPANIGQMIGQAEAQRRDATTDMNGSIAAVHSGSLYLPVQWDNEQLTLYPTYVITKDHGSQVGYGFYGTGPNARRVIHGIPPKGAGKSREMVTYQRTNPFQGRANHTLTVLRTPDAPFNLLGQRVDIESWPIVTHYPVDGGVDSSINGNA